jgi:hypothetical protein
MPAWRIAGVEVGVAKAMRSSGDVTGERGWTSAQKIPRRKQRTAPGTRAMRIVEKAAIAVIAKRSASAARRSPAGSQIR